MHTISSVPTFHFLQKSLHFLSSTKLMVTTFLQLKHPFSVFHLHLTPPSSWLGDLSSHAPSPLHCRTWQKHFCIICICAWLLIGYTLILALFGSVSCSYSISTFVFLPFLLWKGFSCSCSSSASLSDSCSSSSACRS